MKLFRHQQELIDRNPDKWICYHETGTGKTRTAVEWALKGDTRTLVICPKMLQENWRRNTEGMRVLIVSKETFRRDWKKIDCYDQVIIDEVHHMLGHTSQMHKALVGYLKKWNTQRVLGLTATPYSQPWNVYAAAEIMGMPINWVKFRKMFFYEVKMGFKMIPMVKPGIDGQLIEILHKFGNTVKLADCVDMPEQVYETEWFEMTDEQKKRSRDAYDPLPIVRFTREHQIAGGTLKGDEYSESVTFDCPKMERLEELIRENERIVVVCRYLHEIEVMARKFGDIRPAYVLTGETPNRDMVVEEIKTRSSYVVFIQAQCSEGYEIPLCPVMVFYSMDFRYLHRVQMEGRIRRINYPKRNLYLSLVVRDSIDEAIYDAIHNKNSFYIDLYEKNRHNG